MSDRQADFMDIVEKLLVIMFISFILQLIIPGFTELFYFDPSLALSQPWRFITSIFLHGGFAHLFFNSYALFLFGRIVERRVGEREFLKIFLLSGIAGSFLYFLTYLIGLTNLPALGASGAIFGIMGVASVLFPNLEIIIFPIFIPLKLRHAAALWIVIEFLGIFNPYSGIASAAHLGGLLLGLYYGNKIKKRELIEYYWDF